MSTTRFTLQPHLEHLYAERPRPALPTSLPVFQAWQKDMRVALTRLLGLENRPPHVTLVEHLQTLDCGSYTEERLALHVGEQVQIPLVLLIPHTSAPYTPILAFHGHTPDLESILGHYPDPLAAEEGHAHHTNYAQALAAGYLICAIEMRGLGTRLTAQGQANSHPTPCRDLAFSYLLQGRTLLGERIWDAQCVLEYLHTRPDIRPGSIGCTGHSGGGTAALWLAALDTRLTTTVVSGYFCSFKASILGMLHCECNYVPGILTLAEMGELAALLAPRPLCILHGEHDPIFPIPGTLAQYKTVQQAYYLTGHPEACTLAIHPGVHDYHIPTSRAWFDRWLS